MDKAVWEKRLSPILPVLYTIGDETWYEFARDYGDKAYKWLNIVPAAVMHSLFVANTRKRFDEDSTVLCVGSGLSWMFVYRNSTENWEARLKWKKVNDNLLINKPTTQTLSLYVNQIIQFELGLTPDTINLVIGHQSNWIEKPPLHIVCPNGLESNEWTFQVYGNGTAPSTQIPTVELPPTPTPKIVPIIKRGNT